MSADTQDLLSNCEQLPADKRDEVADFARFLLAQNQDAAPRREAADCWLAGTCGVAKPDVTTDQVMTLTRGEP